MRIVRAALVVAAAALGASAVALAVQGPGSPAKGADEERTTVSGTLAAEGRGWRVAARGLGLGPPWWRETAKVADYDGDGVVETVAAELEGMRGRSVTVTGEPDEDGVGVRTLNGKAFREAGRPPWAGGPGKGRGACKTKPQQAGSAARGGPPPWARAHGRKRAC